MRLDSIKTILFHRRIIFKCSAVTFYISELLSFIKYLVSKKISERCVLLRLNKIKKVAVDVASKKLGKFKLSRKVMAKHFLGCSRDYPKRLFSKRPSDKLLDCLVNPRYKRN